VVEHCTWALIYSLENILQLYESRYVLIMKYKFEFISIDLLVHIGIAKYFSLQNLFLKHVIVTKHKVAKHIIPVIIIDPYPCTKYS
jgi:hypothetical protein